MIVSYYCTQRLLLNDELKQFGGGGRVDEQGKVGFVVYQGAYAAQVVAALN